MLSKDVNKAGCFGVWWLPFAVLLLLPFWARTQDAVSILKAVKADARGAATAPLGGTAQAFDLSRNLIFFPAYVDGRRGNFILDTGAPSLLLNTRGKSGKGIAPTGIGAGGEVELTNQRVRSFEMGGRQLGGRWALGLDLRSMEARTGATIDGFVGHDLISRGELRIDYPNRNFRLLPSRRKPLEEGRAPVSVFHFEYIDHLPVITLDIAGHRLRFVIDTGAGKNLIDEKYRDFFPLTGNCVNIQGLDGANQNYRVVQLPQPENIPAKAAQLRFVAMDLSHLQAPGEAPIAGIIGADFLANYCVGIDYRRRRLYLW